MIDLLSEAELSTLKESLKGTEYKEALGKKVETVTLRVIASRAIVYSLRTGSYFML